MPAFLVPFPPTLSSPTSESQAFSGSSLSLSSGSSFNFFGRTSHASSASAYLTDATPPITPSYTDGEKESGKGCTDRISSGPSTGLSFKKALNARDRRVFLSADLAEDTGYDSDCEGEMTPLLIAVDAVCARLKKAKPTANTQRALKFIKEHPSSPSESDSLLNKSLPVTPSMPAMKVVVTEAEEDVTNDRNLRNETKIEAEEANSPAEEVGLESPSQDSLLLDQNEIWRRYGNSEFEKSFHEGLREDMGRSYFPDEIKLFPASTFAFGTGNISGLREEPKSILDEPIEELQADSEFLVEQGMEPAPDTSVMQEAAPPVSLPDSLSPVMPPKPVLRPLEDLDWSCSSLSLGSPSLVYDTSVSISQMIISPQQLDVAPMASSPGVYDISYDNSLISPVIPISTLMFGSRRPTPPVDVLTRGQDLDLPTLMRLEIAAASVVSQQQQQQQLATGLEPGAHPSGGFGLGFDIPPSRLPESSFPSYISLPSIYSLPSWDSDVMPTTSTPSLFAQSAADVEDIEILQASDVMDVSMTEARPVLTDISEEPMSTRALELANESNKPPPVVIGLGLGSLLESTLQSSSSISLMRSPELPPIIGTMDCEDIPASTSVMDVVDGRYRNQVGHSIPAIETFDDVLKDSYHVSVECSGIEPSSSPSEIELSGVLSDVPHKKKRYSHGIERWRRFCAEVEPESVPLNVVMPSSSPVALGIVQPGYCFYSKIDHSPGLSESSSINSNAYHQALVNMQGFPLPLRYPPQHDGASVFAQEFAPLHTENDPRSPVSPSNQIHHTSCGFAAYSSSLQIASGNVQQPQSPVTRDDPSTQNPSRYLVKCTPPSDQRLRSSKSVEGVGMGLPSNLAGRPARQHDISSGMMSSAEECLNLAKLATASPSSDSGSPIFLVSEDRGGSRFFFKIPQFSKRNLYAIAEVLSPPASSSGSSPQTVVPNGRMLSAVWSDLTNRLRSPCKSNQSKFSNSSPHISTSLLAGPSGDARSSATANTQLSAINSDTPISPTSKDISQLHQPPVLLPRQTRFPLLTRLSGLSGLSRSPPPPVHEGAMSPGMVEHLDAPCGLGIFRRRASPTKSTDNNGKKKNRFRPLRKFQLMF